MFSESQEHVERLEDFRDVDRHGASLRAVPACRTRKRILIDHVFCDVKQNSFFFFGYRFFCFKDLNILSTINYSKNLGFIKCGLYLEDFAYLFSWFKDWNTLETLDLSGNKLGLQQMEFFKWLNMNLWNKI